MHCGRVRTSVPACTCKSGLGSPRSYHGALLQSTETVLKLAAGTGYAT